MAKREGIRVLTWDPDKRAWTPQKGLWAGPYTFRGALRACRKLRAMGYTTPKRDNFVMLDRY